MVKYELYLSKSSTSPLSDEGQTIANSIKILEFRANSKETCILDEIKSKKTYETSHHRNQCFRNEVGYANQ